MALAWLRQRGEKLGLPVVPIRGTRRPSRVDENLGSLSVQLDEQTMAVLGGLAGQVVGRRSDNADPDWVSDTTE